MRIAAGANVLPLGERLGYPKDIAVREETRVCAVAVAGKSGGTDKAKTKLMGGE